MKELFCPSNIERYTADVSRVHENRAPTLAQLSLAHGEGALAVVVPFLAYINEFSGCREKMDPWQIRETARKIVSKYGYVNLVELMQFTRKFTDGDLGRFYGAVDPLAIMEGFSAYMSFRAREIEALENERRRIRRESEIMQAATPEWVRAFFGRKEGSDGD